ncbi:MAG: sodium-dependent transporter [Bacteroidaceae bacterium]|jgi:NSS family neurotransmitter:Na+ symporter|nr:sodium-dependent transporter [Bacteroidaceae bacterium]
MALKNRENFGRIGAVLAAAGSAVGLGNIWRFPIETGRNGGAAFVLVYIICVIVLGLPVMISEFMIGRSTQSNTAAAYRKLSPGTQWKWVGRLGVLTGFLIFSYYSVVAGWTVEYAGYALTNVFAHESDYKQMFSNFASNPFWPVLWLFVFMFITHVIIVRGVKSGIERVSKVLMPTLFLLIMMLVFCAITLPGSGPGIDFIIRPDFSKINGMVVLSAMGQAFFSLSIGMGCLCTYASYFRSDTNLTRSAINVASIDTMIAIMSGFIIFPAAASAGYTLTAGDVGPSLIFITLPHVFQQAFSGAPILAYVFSVMFYVLLILAALTSTISMHEVITAYLKEEFEMSRKKAARFVTCSCAFLGIFCALSFGVLSDVKLMDRTIFDWFDFVSSTILLPFGGMLISIFTGWYLNKRLMYDELTNYGTIRIRYFKVLVFILRFVAPVAIGFIFLNELGIFDVFR